MDDHNVEFEARDEYAESLSRNTKRSGINKLISDYCAKNDIIAPSPYFSDEACVEYLFSVVDLEREHRAAVGKQMVEDYKKDLLKFIYKEYEKQIKKDKDYIQYNPPNIQICHAVLEGYIYTYGEPIGNKLIDQGPKYTKDTVDNLVDDAMKRYPVVMTESGPLFGDGANVIGYANIFEKEKGLWAVIQTNDVFYHKFKFVLDQSGMEFANFYGLGFYAVGGSKGRDDFKIRAVTIVRKDYAFHEIEVIYKPAHDSQMLYSLEQKYKKRISYQFNVQDMSVMYMIFDSEMKPLSSIKLYGDETGTLFPLIEELEKLDADERRILTEL